MGQAEQTATQITFDIDLLVPEEILDVYLESLSEVLEEHDMELEIVLDDN
jgi:hypothetical protein